MRGLFLAVDGYFLEHGPPGTYLIYIVFHSLLQYFYTLLATKMFVQSAPSAPAEKPPFAPVALRCFR